MNLKIGDVVFLTCSEHPMTVFDISKMSDGVIGCMWHDLEYKLEVCSDIPIDALEPCQAIIDRGDAPEHEDDG